ncbi:MAG: hypothetical protein DYG85_16080 [Chloroflexi bacterium CFX1]|nr:hypothetical protein [Chloroflexi bacterium CFX1]MCQ3954680.1 hypothetical protein [Chloroflexota bacterium]MDL1918516.1 hypothetical protein [Chloroflexi bacterium CFX5]NUQ60683.1 hypothetical protein [Anaerolineales bacterium]
MKQHEAVIQSLEKLGGQATLAQLYIEAMKIKECKWATKTPFASIRRIVQTRPEIFKVRPGLWALHSYKSELGLADETAAQVKDTEQSHSYYQGLLVTIGNLRGFGTFTPNQDKNKKFVGTPLGDIRSLQEIPQFSYDFFVKRSRTIDVIWFNARQMPNSMFEVEHSTDIQNSLVKFYDLKDFHARMIIVAHEGRRGEFEQKIQYNAFDAIKGRTNFLGYNALVKQYEYELLQASQSFVI